MTWSSTLYLQFADEAEARAVAQQIDADFPSEGVPTGNHNYALAAPIAAPEGETGYWAMLRLNAAWAGYAATLQALGPFLRIPANPGSVFAGGG
jgi:hypothetical protein